MDIQRADPGARRRAVWIVVLGAVAGAVLLLLLEHSLPGIRAWATERSDLTAARVRLVLVVTGTLTIVPLVGFAVYLWLLGERISSAARFPLPSMKILRDTVVVSGQAAVTRSRLVKALAVLLTTLALGLLSILWWVASWVESRLSS
jgi:hypothetical protein